MNYYGTPEYLRLAAAINRKYANACTETYTKTGRPSALYQAEIHRACAAIKESRAAELEK